MVMRRIKDSKTRAAAGADKEEGRRPTIVSAPAAASPELLDRPRRGRPWRGRRDRAPRGALLVGPVGLAAELALSRRDNPRLKQRLERAEAIIEIQKKVAVLLGLPASSDDES